MTKGRWGKNRVARLACTTGLGIVIGAAGAIAQTPPSSFTVEGSIRSELEVDDNGRLRVDSPGTDTSFITTLGLGVNSRTPAQRFDLSLSADLQFEDLAAGEADNGLENPVIRLGYAIEGPDSELSFNGSFRTDDILDSVFLDTDGDLIEDTLLQSDGQIDRLRLGAEYSFGLNAPFGLDFFARRDERDYTNVVDPDLFDRSTDNYGVTARFRINPTSTARVILRETRYDSEDDVQTERDTSRYGLGFAYEFRPDLQFDAEVTQTDITETTTGGVTENDGLSARIGVLRELSNGTLGFVASRVQSTDTARSDVQLTREIVVPAGAFSFGVGVSSSDTGDTALVGSLNYATELPTGELTARLRRTATVNDSNNEVLRTIIGVGYSHDINPVSGLDFGVEYADVDDIGLGDVSESSRADYSITYRRQLTRDWDWRVGYEGRYQRNQSGTTATSNAIVTSIGRTFSLRP